MNPIDFPHEAYLRRIGLKSLPDPTTQGLRALVRAQSLAIAFENLDVLAGVPIRLDRAAIVDKILTRGRGGYCYELNGLMAMALAAAGFDVHALLSRVTYGRQEPGPLTHQVLLVPCGRQRLLIDVGFGGPGLVEPALFDDRHIVEQGGVRFRLFEEEDGDLHLQREIGGAWQGLYRISTIRASRSDLDVANHFVSTHPHSPFRNRFMCVMPVADGCWRIDATELVRVNAQQDVVERRSLRDHVDLLHAMRSTFRVELSDDIAQQAWRQVNSMRPQDQQP